MPGRYFPIRPFSAIVFKSGVRQLVDAFAALTCQRNSNSDNVPRSSINRPVLNARLEVCVSRCIFQSNEKGFGNWSGGRG